MDGYPDFLTVLAALDLEGHMVLHQMPQLHPVEMLHPTIFEQAQAVRWQNSGKLPSKIS